MNNLRLNITIPLGLLTPTGPDTYSFVVKFFKGSDGSPLDSINIPNSIDISVLTTSPNFPIDIPVLDANWMETNVIVKAIANNSLSCCFATKIDTIENTQSPSLTLQAVVLNQFNNVSRYEPSTGVFDQLFVSGSLSPDVAHTSNRIFTYDATGANLVIKEYAITLTPFSRTFVRDYTLGDEYYGAGMCAVSNTQLYIAGEKVHQITLSGTTATPLEMFSLPVGYACTGDLIYDPSTQLMLISYDNTSDYRIGVFNATTGAVVRSAAAPVNNIYGIYQYSGGTYIISGSGQIYSLNLATLVSTIGATIPVTGGTITGGSQIQSNISIPS